MMINLATVNVPFKAPYGFIAYDGPSLFDGKPIVVIITLHSENSKTGNMIQTWIMRQDKKPTEIAKNGEDDSICGNCRFRSGNGCYVNLGQGVLKIWNAYRAGRYPHFNPEFHPQYLKGRGIRLGSYGDPASVPFSIWDYFSSYCDFKTGYTHAWKNNPKLKGYIQASCDSIDEAKEAQLQGWKTFLVINPNNDIPREVGIECLSETHGKQCIDCKLCNGNKTNIIIKLHGLGYKVKRAISVLPT
jgi:hypothetical protein